jgi:two-component system OmpR family response regulator
MSDRVLVVDDDPYISELLAVTLRFAGFDPVEAATGAEALRLIDEVDPKVIVLDVMLPDTDGFELARTLRRRGRHVPVLFLTARDATEDKITGLTLGGDDYITKPFSIGEVLARLQAVLRRSGPLPTTNVLACGDLEMDEDAHLVTRGGRPLELTPTEYRLLRYLLLNAGRVLSKAQILDHVWQYDFGGEGAVVEKFVSTLRRKVDADGPPLVHTVRGFGYALRHGAS